MSIWRICPFCADFIQQGAFDRTAKFASTFGVVHNKQKWTACWKPVKYDYTHSLDAVY